MRTIIDLIKGFLDRMVKLFLFLREGIAPLAAVSILREEGQVKVSAGNEVYTLTDKLPEKRKYHIKMPANTSQENRPLTFFLLLFAITIPYWIFGGNNLPIPIKLPVSAFAAFNPMIAALILTYLYSGSIGVKALFSRAFDFRKIKNRAWYVPTLLLSPLVYALSYVVMRLAGRPLPDVEIPILMVPVFFAVFFVFGIGEELGWMGYAIDPLQSRWGALKAAALMGLVWGLFHLIPDLQNRQTADWILWQRLGTIPLRILIVWIYNNTGKSVFSSVLFHAVNNLSWALFPNFGSHYDPFITGILLFLVTGVVLSGWDSKTLARFRYTNARP